MPERRTLRGAARTALDRDCEVLICGASFAGLAVARELAASGAEVLVIDRYEIGERQTSACGIPTSWLEAMDVMGAHQQTFDELVIHTPHATLRYPLPWTFSTFDYRTLCVLLAEDLGAEPKRFQGNWIPHALRDATEDGVFFVGDSAGHCLPLTAEGIRTALYFGLGCGRELREVLGGRQTKDQALARYHAF